MFGRHRAAAVWLALIRHEMDLDVGRGEPVAGRHECTARRRHARARAVPAELPLQQRLDLAVERAVGVQRHLLRTGPLHDDVEMILQVLPDRGAVMHDLDTKIAQCRRRPDPRQHQQLRRVDRAAAEYRLARPNGFGAAAAAIANPGRAALRKGHRVDLHPGTHLEVRPVHHRRQITARCRPPAAVLDRRVVMASPFELRPVEVVGARNAGLDRGFDEDLRQRQRMAAVGGVQRPAAPVIVIAAPLAVLGATEIGQHVGPAPAGQPGLCPAVVIAGMTTDVDHAVDRRRAAEHAAARPI